MSSKITSYNNPQHINYEDMERNFILDCRAQPNMTPWFLARFYPAMPNEKRMQNMVRQVERESRSAERDLSRIQMEFERQEKMLVAEIRKYARLGDKEACNRLAKQLVSVRKKMAQNTRLTTEVAQSSNQVRLSAANVRMMRTIQGTTNTLQRVNKQLDTEKVAKNMQDFQKLTLDMNMKEELMDDMMNDLDLDQTNAEDAVIDQVLSSLAIDVGNQLDKVRMPTDTISTSREATSLSDLEKQLEGLRN